jgi:hypothetical protein
VEAILISSAAFAASGDDRRTESEATNSCDISRIIELRAAKRRWTRETS